MTKKELYGVNEKQYLFHLKIRELEAKIELLQNNYQTNYALINFKLNNKELSNAIQIQKEIKYKQKALMKWKNLYKELK